MEGGSEIALHRTKRASWVAQLRIGVLCSVGVVTAVALLGLPHGTNKPPSLETQELGVLQVDFTLEAGSPKISTPVRAKAATDLVSLPHMEDDRAWKQRATPEHAACKASTGTKVESAAVVGNGPITNRQRGEISKHGIVVRFNFLNNMWREQERMDVWAVRYSFDAKHRFWGFGQMPPAEALAVLNKTKALWLISSESHKWAVDELIKDVPQVAQHLPTFINQDDFFYGKSHTAPSTGLSMLRACLPPAVKVHIYGMNWSPKIWEGHDVVDEAEQIRQMERHGQVQIHKAPCKGLRTCQSVELDSDCHFDLRRQFVCPKVNSDGHPLDERKYGTVREVMVHAATRHTDYIGDIAHIHGKLRRKRPRDR